MTRKLTQDELDRLNKVSTVEYFCTPQEQEKELGKLPRIITDLILPLRR